MVHSLPDKRPEAIRARTLTLPLAGNPVGDGPRVCLLVRRCGSVLESGGPVVSNPLRPRWMNQDGWLKENADDYCGHELPCAAG